MTPTTVRGGNRPTPPATAARRARLVAAYLAVITVVGYLVVITVVGYLVVGTYALWVVGYLLALGAIVLAIRAIDVAVTRSLRRHVDAALNVTSLELYRARKAHPAGRRRLG